MKKIIVILTLVLSCYLGHSSVRTDTTSSNYFTLNNSWLIEQNIICTYHAQIPEKIKKLDYSAEQLITQGTCEIVLKGTPENHSVYKENAVKYFLLKYFYGYQLTERYELTLRDGKIIVDGPYVDETPLHIAKRIGVFLVLAVVSYILSALYMLLLLIVDKTNVEMNRVKVSHFIVGWFVTLIAAMLCLVCVDVLSNLMIDNKIGLTSMPKNSLFSFIPSYTLFYILLSISFLHSQKQRLYEISQDKDVVR